MLKIKITKRQWGHPLSKATQDLQTEASSFKQLFGMEQKRWLEMPEICQRWYSGNSHQT